ncbi:MAG: hypothetical protein MZU95_06900 [Desulfomicrobium escambiense]|nr:hypothetical protein [Desulfomicrobium escambiense]
MGILTTVKATRAASLDDLLALCLRRLDRMLLAGTTTVEAKSGYGLNLEDEIKQLEALRDLAALHPVDIVPTFMGAHEVPPEYRDRREDYVRLLVDTIIPEVARPRPGRVLRRLLRAGRLLDRGDAAARRGGPGRRLQDQDPRRRVRLARAAPSWRPRSGPSRPSTSSPSPTRASPASAPSPTAAILLPGVPFFLMMDQARPGPAPRRRRGGRRPGLGLQSGQLPSQLDAVRPPARRLHPRPDGRGGHHGLHRERGLRHRAARLGREPRSREEDGPRSSATSRTTCRWPTRPGGTRSGP